jgi:hypothetical protein
VGDDTGWKPPHGRREEEAPCCGTNSCAGNNCCS